MRKALQLFILAALFLIASLAYIQGGEELGWRGINILLTGVGAGVFLSAGLEQWVKYLTEKIEPEEK